MEPVKTIDEMKKIARRVHGEGKTLGLVPTMGFLHEGHLSLIRRAVALCDCTAISVFVNPKQFVSGEDLDKYPADFERDRDMARDAGVDFFFFPGVRDMYPEGFQTEVHLPGMSKRMCGLSRPTHFQGVATVVLKLFNIVRPDVAVFGQKDAQQSVVIKRMVRDLDLDVKIDIMPIVREPDGLAMSSRNTYLSSEERASALCLYRSLEKARAAVEQGQRFTENILDIISHVLAEEQKVQTEYIVICDAGTLEELDALHGRVLIALAARVGKTRLIDNVIITAGNDK